MIYTDDIGKYKDKQVSGGSGKSYWCMIKTEITTFIVYLDYQDTASCPKPSLDEWKKKRSEGSTLT